MIALSIAYLLGGLTLAFKLDALLPRYRKEIINLVTTGFCIGVALNLWGLFSAIQDPGQLGPSATKENSLLFIIALGIVSVAFNFLVYKIIVNCINAVSNVSSSKQTLRQTALYWSIVILFFVTMLAAIFWDPTTNSLNVL